MIRVTDLHGTEFLLNSDQIEKVEHNPDTQILLLNGHRFYVRESMDEIVERVTQFRAGCNEPWHGGTAEDDKE